MNKERDRQTDAAEVLVCDYYDDPEQDCLTAGTEVLAAEGLCGPCAGRALAAAEARGAQAVLAAVEEAQVRPTQAGGYYVATVGDIIAAARAAAAVTTSSAKSSDLATRVPQDESQRAAGGGG